MHEIIKIILFQSNLYYKVNVEYFSTEVIAFCQATQTFS